MFYMSRLIKDWDAILRVTLMNHCLSFHTLGFKSRRDVPMLVRRYVDGELPIDHYVTHEFEGVEKTNDAIHALHGGSCLRAVVKY